MKPEFSFPDLGEFRFVENILKDAISLPCDVPKTRSWLHAGDDAAQFDGWLVTKDLSVEGTHFRLDWSTVEESVEKNIVSNVSDISAMGGVPKVALLGLCLNKKWSFDVKQRVAKAFSTKLRERGIALIGGDTVSGDIGMYSLTLLGVPSEKVLLRNKARLGDNVYVTGTLGRSAAGLWILENCPEKRNLFPSLVNYHLCPKIQEQAGVLLVQRGVSGACMDISDGLSSELNHLAKSSGVGMVIFEKKLPIDKDVIEMCAYFDLNPLNFALNGGEEYELLFTNDSSKVIFGNEKDFLVTCIGQIVEGTNVQLSSENGMGILSAGAFTHL